jgi:hypothetical protein
MSDILHMPPIRAPRRFWLSLFGASAAPIFWLGQLILAYWVTAVACYGSDHPTTAGNAGVLRSLLIGFDVVAIVACVAGAIAAYSVLGSARDTEGMPAQVAGRLRMLGLWGLLSSLCFFTAIVFTTIASLGVPLCAP